MKLATAAAALVAGALARNNLTRTPPMGWMSWEIFRCEVDCTADPNNCINAQLYQQQADALVAGGYLAAGYNGIHVDDCWMQARDPTSGALVANTTRFPQGFAGLAAYTHSKGVQFAAYTAESPTTCAGYPASAGHEALDANTFASWQMDYVKVDGCGDASYYPTGYPLMGASLQASGRNIVYSCSWPAYLGDDETTKPWPAIIAAGCNLWRNWDDIQCSWGSLVSIIDHFGDYSAYLQQWAAPGHFHDPDMLLIGNDCIMDDEARTQMAIWSILAAPLIMGNDLRNVSASTQAILVNPEAIAVDQDPLGMMGMRMGPQNSTEVWARNMSDGSVAVALFNKLGPNPVNSSCPTWNHTTGGYLEACGGGGGDLYCFSDVTVAAAQAWCCDSPQCAGFSYNQQYQSGCYKTNTDCGFVTDPAYQGWDKPSFNPTSGPADITVTFTDVGFPAGAKVQVRDIWARQTIGTFTGTYTAKAVPFHGTAFLRLTAM